MRSKRNVFNRSLRLLALWAFACCLLFAGVATADGPGHDDGSLDVFFGFGTTLDQNSSAADGATNYGKILTTDVLGNTVAAGVGNFGWGVTANSIALNGTTFGSSLSTGFFHNSVFGSKNGKIVFESNIQPQTFGASPLPHASSSNRATFHDAVFTAGDLGVDATGVVGFLSSAGNWGYLEFDWAESTSTMTVLSARVQRLTGQPITFTPSVGVSTTVPEPSSMLLFSIGSALFLPRRSRCRS